ncbi:hypothetical protein Pan153_37750 [Gimesia panareensis]|uniref:Uncharacterized protein n=1 Tax=Gimesia panareensis TaxID=2527978 RepID=A0A518FRZ6_9PLAN|nr:hypothetical protein Pan153_37750 [Gimesia panareensis]
MEQIPLSTAIDQQYRFRQVGDSIKASWSRHFNSTALLTVKHPRTQISFFKNKRLP